ncbi:MAG: HAD-IIIA family hydrolase, partial [Ferruginibacter sp.]
DDLHTIHANMLEDIVTAGGHIDAIYYCSDINGNSEYRKPNPGMGHEAIKEFPDIDIKKSLMVGNTLSDMQFGRNLGVYTVFLPTTRPEVDISHKDIDAVYPSLIAFAKAII